MTDVWAWTRETTRLLHLWGDAERLCCSILHKIDWTNRGDRRQQLLAALERARLRSDRRYSAMRDYEKRNK